MDILISLALNQPFLHSKDTIHSSLFSHLRKKVKTVKILFSKLEDSSSASFDKCALW